MSLETFLQMLQDNDPVEAGVVNLPLRQLDQNIRYLWQLIQAASVGSTIYARQVAIEPAAGVGMPVWFNTTTGRFERALATLDPDPSSGVLQTSQQAQVWGVVADKTSAGMGDILLYGYTALDVSVATGSPVKAGVYYLSASTPGVLIQQRPPVSVAVLRADGAGNVFVMPQFVDFLDRHTHYQFKLTCLPAGVSPTPSFGQPHVITSVDRRLAGWLPANDPSFNGLAPPGAAFGYNLAAQPALKNAWPPLPLGQAYIEWNRGEDPKVIGQGVPLGPHTGLCVLDRNGIWWMSDCYGDAPWPTLGDFAAISDSYGGYVDASCPRRLEMEMTLWFSKVNFATDATVVKSLQAGDPRIKVLCVSNGLPASTGDLVIELDLNLTVATNQAGYQVLKTFNPVNSTFTQGPVVEGIYALSSNVTLVAESTQTEEVNDQEQQIAQGLVGISVSTQPSLEVPVELVRLDGVEEEYYQNMMYLGFLPAQASDLRGRISIPSDLAIATPKLRLRFLVLGTATGTLPQLTFTALIAHRPSSGLSTPLTLPSPSSEFSVTCASNGVLSAPYQYVEAKSSSISVSPGDVVFFTVSRGATDGYTGEVGILQQTGALSST